MGPGQGTPQELALPFSHCCYSLGWEARQLTSPLPRHARRRPGWVWGPATQPPAQSPQPTFMGARWAASSLSKGGGPFLSVWPMAGRGRVWCDPRPPPPHSAPPAGSHRAASRPVLQGLSSSLGHSFPGLGRAPGHPAPVPSHRAGVCRGWGALTARVTRAPKFCRRAASGPSRGPPRVLRVPRAGRSPQLGPAEALARRGRAGPRAGDGWAARLSSDPGRAGGGSGGGGAYLSRSACGAPWPDTSRAAGSRPGDAGAKRAGGRGPRGAAPFISCLRPRGSARRGHRAALRLRGCAHGRGSGARGGQGARGRARGAGTSRSSPGEGRPPPAVSPRGAWARGACVPTRGPASPCRVVPAQAQPSTGLRPGPGTPAPAILQGRLMPCGLPARAPPGRAAGWPRWGARGSGRWDRERGGPWQGCVGTPPESGLLGDCAGRAGDSSLGSRAGR